MEGKGELKEAVMAEGYVKDSRERAKKGVTIGIEYVIERGLLSVEPSRDETWLNYGSSQ